MLSFKQKIFISYVVIYLIFILFMLPFGSHTVKKIVNMGMEERANEIIQKIQTAKNEDGMIRLLKEEKALTFFRFSVIADDYLVLYDSHAKRILGPQFSQQHLVRHTEVIDAFDNGVGYSEGYSELLGQKLVYFAKEFKFQGKSYVLRTALPYKYVSQLTHDFEEGFFLVSSAVLLIFGLITWIAIKRLTAPIEKIIEAVRPYQEEQIDTIPLIKTLSMNPQDDFGKLALTLNSLSEKIQKQIDTLKSERNEKEAVLETLIEGVIAVDHKMTITYANKIALQFLEKEGINIIGTPFDSTCTPYAISY